MGQRFLHFVLLFVIGFSVSKAADNDDRIGAVGARHFTDVKDSVDMLSGLSVKIKSYTVYINWRITNPEQISYFDVQRLDPKKKEFKTLTKENHVKLDDYFEKAVDGNGLNVLKFDFEDEPEHDGVYFYRINAFDRGGKLLFTSDETKIGIMGLRNFDLEQNYPNPFNPTTNISYELFTDSYVKLKVFDLIGKEIAVLVDKYQTAGTYTVEFDASRVANLTSGIYFYKLDTDRYSEVKKMILTK